MKELSAKELKAQKKAEKQASRAAKKGGAIPQQNQPGTAQGTQAAPLAGAQATLQTYPVPVNPQSSQILVSSPDVHPAVLNLAIQMQHCRVLGSSLRCKSMLFAFAKVIQDYEPPAGTGLCRALAGHLSRQIETLKAARALGVAMGNAIRWLKQECSQMALDSQLSDEEARESLVSQIHTFIRERIEVADRVIVEQAVTEIHDKDVVLTFGRSGAILDTIKEAHRRKINFRLVVVDSHPLYEGRQMATEALELGVPTSYLALSGLSYVLSTVTVVLLGAHAMVSNGHLYSRCGTALVAMASAARNLPVIVLCETLKFSERVQIDALVPNEPIPATALETVPEKTITPEYLFYDLADKKYISKVITELGAVPASSVPVILREYKAQA